MTFNSTLLISLLAVFLWSCDGGGACADSTQCGKGAACVSSGLESTCLPLCEAQSACAGAEFCLPRVEEAAMAVLVWPDVCVPPEMLLSSEPPSGCDARGANDCEVDTECFLDTGWRLDRSRRCRERVRVGCLPALTACLDSGILTHSTEGDLIYFSSTCWPYGFAPLDLQPDDPLFEELYSEESSFQSWPDCE